MLLLSYNAVSELPELEMLIKDPRLGYRKVFSEFGFGE